MMMSLAVLSALTDAGMAQQPSSTPTFEAASVKRSITNSSGWSVSYTPDSLHATNATLSSLIQSAYGVRPDRLVGGPNWVRTTRFDVNAKAAQALPREQLRQMARRLLENRFGLVLTKEQREQEAYVMRLARADGRLGPDVRRAPDDCADGIAPGGVPTTIQAAGPPLQSSTGARPTFSGRCATIASVAGGLSRNLGIEVVDQTGLQGRWDYVIAYAPLTVDGPAALEPAQASLPSVFVAIEEQLGLKLERNPHGTAEYVIIAQAHAPTEN
jgi:uncharacterized protein (TIGR03435 family)